MHVSCGSGVKFRLYLCGGISPQRPKMYIKFLSDKLEVLLVNLKWHLGEIYVAAFLQKIPKSTFRVTKWYFVVVLEWNLGLIFNISCRANAKNKNKKALTLIDLLLTCSLTFFESMAQKLFLQDLLAVSPTLFPITKLIHVVYIVLFPWDSMLYFCLFWQKRNCR